MLREILVSGLREYLAGIRIGLPVTQLAKWKTGFQMGALGTLLAGDPSAAILHLSFLPVGLIGEAMLWVAAGLTLLTGWDYLTAGAAPQRLTATARAEAVPTRAGKRGLQVLGIVGWSGSGKTTLLDRADPAACARARPDAVHGQARAPGLRHGPAGQGHLPPSRGRRA